MVTISSLDAKLRRLGRTLSSGPSVVDAVMAAVAGEEFSPSVRSAKLRRWSIRTLLVAACALLALGGWMIAQHEAMRHSRRLAGGSQKAGDTASVRTNVPVPAAVAVAPSSEPLSARTLQILSRTDSLFSTNIDKVLLATAKWGYIDTTGRVVIAAQFRSVKGFSEGRAAVKVEDRWGYIDVLGQMVVAAQFAYASDFSEGLATVEMDGKRGYIDPAGNVVIAPQFESSMPFHEGLAAVKPPGRRRR